MRRHLFALIAALALSGGHSLAKGQTGTQDAGAPAQDPPVGEAPAPDEPVPAPVEDDVEQDATPDDVEDDAAPEDAEPSDDVLTEDAVEATIAEEEDDEEILGVGGADEDLEGDDEDAPARLGVTASLSDADVFRAGGSIARLDPTIVARLRYDDPTTLVQRVPGVTVRNEDGFGLRPNISIRGTNPERSRSVTLMEDGVLFGPAPYSAPAAYYFPLIGRIASVDVFKGPAAIQFGPQTVGGALDFVTRAVPTTPTGTFDFAYGSYGTRRMHLFYGQSFRHFGFLVEAVDVGSLGFKEIDLSRESTGFSRTEAVVRAFVQSDTARHVYHRLDLKLMYGRERSNETYLGLSDADFAANPDRRYAASAEDVMRTQRFSYQLTHRLEVGSHVRLRTTLYRHDYDRRWHRFDRFGPGAPALLDILANPTVGANRVFYDILAGNEDSDQTLPSNRILLANNDRIFVSQGIQSELRFDAETGPVRHELLVGARLHYDRIDRDHTSESYYMLDGHLVRDATDPTQTAHERASTVAVALHALYALEYGRLRVTPGVRTEILRMMMNDHLAARRNVTHHQVVLGGLGANVRILDWLGVYAGVHRGFGPVAPGQSEDIDPELSVDTELGVRVRNEDIGLVAELGGYVNHYSNMLLVCTGAGGCAPEDIDMQFNAGEVRVGGIEAAVSQTFSLPHGLSVPLRATYAYQRSRFLNSFTAADPQYRNVMEGDEVPYLPRHQATVSASLEHERASVTITGNFVAEMREQAGSGDTGFFTEPQAILDAMGDVRLHDRVALTWRVENFTNARPIVAHRPLGARPYRPLMALVGVRFDL